MSCVVLWDINMHVPDVSVQRVTVCTLHVAIISLSVLLFGNKPKKLDFVHWILFHEEARGGWV